MSYTALDYSTPIKASDLAAATVDGQWKITTVFRYITDPAWPKSLQADEYADLIHHGFKVYLLDEGTDDYMVNGSYAGFAGGATRARERRARANQIGAGGPIFYSLDIGATPEQIDVALEFLAGAHSVDPGGVAAYGEYAFVKAAADSGYPILGTVAWSNGQRDPRAVAWQLARQITVAGVQCDVDDLNPSYVPPTPPGGPIMSNTIPASISQRYGFLAGDFPAGGTYDDTTALIWADARAAAAAHYGEQILTELQALSGKVGQAPTVDVAALAAALAPHLTAGATADELAVAVVDHLQLTVSSK